MDFHDLDNQAAFSHRPSMLGVHYYPDQQHYTGKDLSLWLPILEGLHVNWVVLFTDSRRAIPESFLTSLIGANVQPVLWFRDSLATPPGASDMEPLLRSYGQWGVRHAIFFDRPNMQTSWPRSTWASANIVEKFLDSFLPLGNLAMGAGLSPLLPPLQPGGDYWDTTFLRALLRSLRKRADQSFLQSVGLSAYGWTFGHPLSWGAGGPERWPADAPSGPTPGVEGHLGFHVYEWYLALAEAELGRKPPVFLLQAGLPQDQAQRTDAEVSALATQTAGLVTHLLTESSEASADWIGSPLPEELLSVDFWLLSAGTGDTASAFAWYAQDGTPGPTAMAVQQAEANLPDMSSEGSVTTGSHAKDTSQHPLRHYLLVPLYPWGVSEWHLKAIQPLIQKDHPVVGFSLREARLAKKVTVVGDPSIFPDDTIRALRLAGCEVERLPLAGIDLAPSAANR